MTHTAGASGARIFRDRRGTIEGGRGEIAVVSLAEMRPGESGRIAGIKSADARLLQKLLAMAVLPGSEVRVDLTFPTFVLRVGNTRVAVDRGIAEQIGVERSLSEGSRG